MGPIVAYDEFRLVDDGAGGSIIRIKTTLRGRTLLGKRIAPVAAPMMHAWMKKIWRDAALLCEEDAVHRKSEAAP